jgi:hypothetical protein
MKEIYGTTWALLRRNPGFYLSLACLLASAEAMLRAMDPGASGTIVPWVLVAYSLHRLLLLGEVGKAKPRPDAPGSTVGRFLFVTLLLLGSMAVPFGVLVWSLPRVDPASIDVRVVVEIFFLGVGAMHGLVLALFGTALPAAAVKDRFGLHLTLRRGRRTARAVLLGFLVGPAAAGLVLTATSSALDAWWEPFRLSLEPRALGETLGVLALIPLQLARLLNATLMAVVLCKAYRAVAPPAVLAVLEPHPTLDGTEPDRSPA